MPIKIFENSDTKVLESEVSKFIAGKKVLNTSMSSSVVGNNNKFYPSETKYQILIHYETGNKSKK